ncbi:MAG: aminotransferase class III-fold pyridoxal phosphate-dependent enzyme, partial [Melioribacter sp.]|nr:aminotransferase class III-fold pyridoxal phosphate-dependent enzyme [Melioribacter sp.]
VGKYLLEKLLEVQKDFPHLVSQARGLGLMCAFDMPTPEIRKRFLTKLFENKMLMLGCGVSTVRFRPPLIITKEEVDKGIEIIRRTLRSI